MEAYGDEYEPPPAKRKPSPSSLNSLGESAILPDGRKVAIPENEADQMKMIEELLAGMFSNSTGNKESSSSGSDQNLSGTGAVVTERPFSALPEAEKSQIVRSSLETTDHVTIRHSLTDNTIDQMTTTPVPNPSLITPQELENAMIFEQAGQPKVLIVDRRTKKKTKPAVKGKR